MPFPLSLSGTATCRGISVDEAMARLEAALRSAQADALVRAGPVIRFRGGASRLVSKMNILIPITSGELEVSSRGPEVSVRYRITFGRMLVFVTLSAGAFFQFAAASPAYSSRQALGVAALAWVWLFGGNFALTVWRWPRFLDTALGTRASAPGASPVA